MTLTVDPVITAEHSEWIQDVLRSKGIPGKAEVFGPYLEITPPIWGDPVALEILRPVVEHVLLQVAQEIKKKRK